MLTDIFNLCTNNDITKAMYMTDSIPEKNVFEKNCCWKFAAGSSSKFPAAGPVHRDTKAMLTDNISLCTYNEDMKVMYVTGASPEKNVFKKICCWKFAAGTSSCWIQ